MIHDLRPNATKKWHKGIITKVLGPLNYEVNIDGYTCQAHVDHILPCPSTSSDADNFIDSIPHQDEDDLPMPLVGCEPCETSNDTAELVTLSPCRNCRPPKRLIGEMN